ncbi:MAG: hypothetical protein MK086_00615 [Flavobacteriales bacterium]|nr:hypothetical protein [Flavobacteriales bacterium]
MPIKTYHYLILILFPALVHGQYNQLDENGEKHGLWQPTYENGQFKYNGHFEHGIPVGIFMRWYDDGSLQGEINHRTKEVSYAKLFYPQTGVKMAEGIYLKQRRDSVWNFYSEDGVLTSKESYREGLKNGLAEIFYPDGSIAERAVFANDEKNGLWEQFFNNGRRKLKAHVIEGLKYDGEYTTYYTDGMKLEQGNYVNGKKESSWYLFNEDGSIHMIYVYRDDEIEEEFPKNGTFETYWDNDIKRAEYTYKDGLKNGPFKEWFNQGEWKNEERIDEYGNKYPIQKLHGTQISREGAYKKGKLDGEIVTYTTGGKVKERLTYRMGELSE